MVKAYPEEFRRDVMAVARKGEASVRQVAKDFEVSESCLARCLRLAACGLRLADRDDGISVASAPSAKAVEQAQSSLHLAASQHFGLLEHQLNCLGFGVRRVVIPRKKAPHLRAHRCAHGILQIPVDGG